MRLGVCKRHLAVAISVDEQFGGDEQDGVIGAVRRIGLADDEPGLVEAEQSQIVVTFRSPSKQVDGVPVLVEKAARNDLNITIDPPDIFRIADTQILFFPFSVCFDPEKRMPNIAPLILIKDHVVPDDNSIVIDRLSSLIITLRNAFRLAVSPNRDFIK